MIAECGQALIEQLQQHMVPHDIASNDLIKLRVPQLKDQDYVIGAYLYHIAEDHEHAKQDFVNISEQERQLPGKVLSLSYVLFVNEEATFGGFHKEQEDRLLERMIQIFHDYHSVVVLDQTCTLYFDSLDVDSRIRLWQSFSKPLQPAIYMRLCSVVIPSTRREVVHRVKRRDVIMERKDL